MAHSTRLSRTQHTGAIDNRKPFRLTVRYMSPTTVSDRHQRPSRIVTMPSRIVPCYDSNMTGSSSDHIPISLHYPSALADHPDMSNCESRGDACAKDALASSCTIAHRYRITLTQTSRPTALKDLCQGRLGTPLQDAYQHRAILTRIVRFNRPVGLVPRTLTTGSRPGSAHRVVPWHPQVPPVDPFRSSRSSELGA